jgi:hypothetical protein
MSLKPDVSLGVALATATVVYGIHQNLTPPIADVRSLEKNNADIGASERAATWTSAAVVAGISLLAKDPTVFIVGGTMVVVMSWITKHADQVDTVTKRASTAMNPLTQIGTTPAQLAVADTPSQGSALITGYSSVV